MYTNLGGTSETCVQRYAPPVLPFSVPHGNGVVPLSDSYLRKGVPVVCGPGTLPGFTRGPLLDWVVSTAFPSLRYVSTPVRGTGGTSSTPVHAGCSNSRTRPASFGHVTIPFRGRVRASTSTRVTLECGDKQGGGSRILSTRSIEGPLPKGLLWRSDTSYIPLVATLSAKHVSTPRDRTLRLWEVGHGDTTC